MRGHFLGITSTQIEPVLCFAASFGETRLQLTSGQVCHPNKAANIKRLMSADGNDSQSAPHRPECLLLWLTSLIPRTGFCSVKPNTFFLLLTLTVGVTSVAEAQFIVAHRGASYDAPENTLAAFRLAWERNADAIEGDFYLTADQQIACIHDKTTKRTAPNQPELSVAESTLAELRTVDVGSWKNARFADERIPTLEEVLATVPDGKQIFVEIKCGPEILPVLSRQLAASKLKPEQITLICFDAAVVTEARKTMRQYRANWLTGYRQESETSPWTPSIEDVLKTLVRTKATGLGSQGNLKVIDAKFVEKVRRAGFGFHVWTVNDPEAARTFRSLGAESITTDRPAFIRKALADR